MQLEVPRAYLWFSRSAQTSLLLLYSEHKTQQSHKMPQTCIASAALQRTRSGPSRPQRSRPGSTTWVGKATSTGDCWIVSILQPKSIRFVLLFLKRKHSCLSHLILSQFTTKTKSQRWGCYCVQQEQNLLGPQGPVVQRKHRKCSFWCFYSKVDPNLKTVLPARLRSQSNCFYGTQSTHL